LDEVSERNKAEKVVDGMYHYLHVGNFEKAGLFFGNTFYAATSKSELHEIFAKTKKSLGGYKNKTLISWKTRRIEGSNPS
jgi:hypothetical protein